MSELVMEVEWAWPPAEVFAAFENPERMRRWYGIPPGCQRIAADEHVGLGETFRVSLRDAQGVPFAQVGRVVSVEPGARVELEMAWEGGALGREMTRVLICLHPEGGGTRLEVRQGPFASPHALEAHRAYWEACLGRLARVVSGEAVPCFEEFWEESRGFTGQLGVAAYAVLAGLREAGAAPEVIAQVEETLYTHLARLPEETVGVLEGVLYASSRSQACN